MSLRDVKPTEYPEQLVFQQFMNPSFKKEFETMQTMQSQLNKKLNTYKPISA